MSERHFKIRINSLHPTVPVTFDVFVLINDKFVHYLRAGTNLTADKIKRLDSSSSDVFYILEQDKPAYKKYVQDQLKNEELTSRDKALILRESSLVLVEELFESPDVEKALNESKEVINDFVKLMETEPESMAHLIHLSTHDFYTYNHSLDVGIYSLGLGAAAGYARNDLIELGQGALFHDIGKRMVNVEIICKNGPLDDIEWAQMQKHPQFGLKILNDYKNVSEEVKACTFEHHENFLGNGYPQQLSGEEIHPMARIVAITDTFDALTTKRSYNQPMTPKTALDFMKEKLSTKYDSDLLTAMYSVLFKMKAEAS